jgi:type III pantothenate kinase
VTPDVVADIGNSRMKWGRVADGRVAEAAALDLDDAIGWKRQCELWGLTEATRWALAGVVPRVLKRFETWLAARGMAAGIVTSELFTGDTLIDDDFDDSPDFVTAVEEPERIGIDRLLTALAAWRRTPRGASAVAISVGTAMTIDFVEATGLHRGGAILPGPRLMARSLHEHTAKLPLVEIRPKSPTMTWGENTEDAIELGIASAILGAADQMVWDWASARGTPPWVFATGGDVGYFHKFEFTADVGRFVIDPTLTLDGIRIAAEGLP